MDAALPFDPIGGTVGGLLIGLAAAIMLIGAGRIAGVSGIAARALTMRGASMPRRTAWLFLLGLPLGTLAVASVRGVPTIDYVPLPTVIVAGALVGFGTRLGSGCTSGHGVCGVSRLSARSIVATGTFMTAGVVTVALQRLAGF
nr:YeeE/YedE thiosulfate transporter family protein [uncultured Sphingomonas sp.]